MDGKAEYGLRFKGKVVLSLSCKYCKADICQRGMKAILLADSNVNLFSTDKPPSEGTDMIGGHYTTSRCRCKVMNVGCKNCGSCVGYMVAVPCPGCLRSCHNGHLWMFHSGEVESAVRVNRSGSDVLHWGDLLMSDEADVEDIDSLEEHVQRMR